MYNSNKRKTRKMPAHHPEVLPYKMECLESWVDFYHKLFQL